MKLAVLLAALLALLWALAAHHATAVAQTDSPIARTALGAGFWSLMALGWLACLDAVGRLQLRTLPRLAVLALATLPALREQVARCFIPGDTCLLREIHELLATPEACVDLLVRDAICAAADRAVRQRGDHENTQANATEPRRFGRELRQR